MTSKKMEVDCPLAPVHKRLEDAHKQWHQAQTSYFSPDGFRLAIQSCIQTLRTVTFVLQNNKGLIQNYEEWYSGWQAKFRADSIMRWAVDARNHIEKQGDLETYSELKVSVVASYHDNFDVVSVDANLFDDVQAMLSNVPREIVENHIFEHGALRVERRWVANTLPSHELLDALGYIYGALSKMLDDAHAHMGLPVPYLGTTHGDETVAVAGGGPIDGRLPCMLIRDEISIAMFSLKDGISLKLFRETKKFHKDELHDVAEKYGLTPEKNINPPTDLRATARMIFTTTRKIFEVDGYHVPMALLFKENKPVAQIELRYDNRNDKYLLMRELAKEVERTAADSIIHISEIWIATADQIPPMGFAVDAKERKEAVSLAGCSRDETFELSAEIVRSEDNVKLADTIEEDVLKSDMFDPIREVWRKQDKAV